MKPAQIARLKALLAKSEPTGDEAKELLKLKALAAKNNIDPETGNPPPTSEDKEGEESEESKEEAEGLSEAQVKTLVADSTARAFEGIGLDKDTIKALKARLNENTASTPEEISAAIREVLGGDNVDMKALAEAIKKGLPEKALTEEKIKGLLTGMFDEFKKDQRRESKMAFPMGEANFPIEHRSGNLTVAQKQLLNVCMMHVHQSGLDNSDGGRGIERPKHMNEGITAEQLKSAERTGDMHTKRVRHECVYGVKALTTTGAGTGLELINVDLSSDLQSRMYLESLLAAQLIASEIVMPSNPFKLPLSTTRPVFHKIGENVAAVPSNPGTGAITLDAKKLVGYVEYSYESDEDAIIAILPWLQEMMGKGAVDALEDAFINGDDNGTHMDLDTTLATDARKLFKGLRYYAHQVPASMEIAFTGGITAANVGALRKLLKRYGLKPADLFIVAGARGYNDLVMLAETLTMDKVGGAARILTGVAPQIYGIPIIPSAKMREDVGPAGINTGVPATDVKGSMLMVYRPAWYVGVKRGITIEVDVNKVTQTNQVICSLRRDFKPRETPSAAEPLVAAGINW
jgi:HK97 family phage major capsid protein